MAATEDAALAAIRGRRFGWNVFGGPTRRAIRMISILILMMVRRTVTLPDSTDQRVRELAHEGESFSAAVARLLDEGTRAVKTKPMPSYVGTGDSGLGDLGLNAEKYLDEILRDFDD